MALVGGVVSKLRVGAEDLGVIGGKSALLSYRKTATRKGRKRVASSVGLY